MSTPSTRRRRPGAPASTAPRPPNSAPLGDEDGAEARARTARCRPARRPAGGPPGAADRAPSRHGQRCRAAGRPVVPAAHWPGGRSVAEVGAGQAGDERQVARHERQHARRQERHQPGDRRHRHGDAAAEPSVTAATKAVGDAHSGLLGGDLLDRAEQLGLGDTSPAKNAAIRPSRSSTQRRGRRLRDDLAELQQQRARLVVQRRVGRPPAPARTPARRPGSSLTLTPTKRTPESAVSVGDLVEGRRLGAARRAPGRPEVQDDDLAAQVGTCPAARRRASVPDQRRRRLPVGDRRSGRSSPVSSVSSCGDAAPVRRGRRRRRCTPASSSGRARDAGRRHAATVTTGAGHRQSAGVQATGEHVQCQACPGRLAYPGARASRARRPVRPRAGRRDAAPAGSLYVTVTIRSSSQRDAGERRPGRTAGGRGGATAAGPRRSGGSSRSAAGG